MNPVQWLAKLEGELAARHTSMRQMDDYFEGEGPLPFVTRAHLPKIRNEFRQMLQDSRANFMGLVVDAVAQRLKVEGIRLSASADREADRASWDTWQANQMDSESQVAFVEALVKGVAYLSVWTPEVDGGYASIAVEDPLQTVVGYEPGSNFRRRAAALKVWKDDWTGVDRANVYLPDGIYKFQAAGSEIGGATVSGDESSFEDPERHVVRGSSAGKAARWLEIPGSFVPNPLGEVPIVALRNRPRLLREGQSELASVYRIQDQINGFLFLLALAGYMGAHRQRWAIGITLYDADNQKLEPFDVAVDKLWATENPNAKFGDFEQTSLDGYLKALDQKVQHIAITTQTPKHFLLPEGQEPSGDAIKSAEAGLVKKVEDKQTTFGEGLEEALRLARRFQGEQDAPVDSEIVWADPQIRTEAEITDAAVKKLAAGLIDRSQALEDLGYSPQQINRMMADEQSASVAAEADQIAREAAAAAELAALIAPVVASVGRVERETIELRGMVLDLAGREPPPPPEPQHIAITFEEGAVAPSFTMADGAVRSETHIDEGAVKVDVGAPPPANVQVDAPITVEAAAPAAPPVVNVPPAARPRSATIRREAGEIVGVDYTDEENI